MKTLRICCYALGTALLLAALFLVLHNVREDSAGGAQAEQILSALREAIPEYVPEPAETMPAGEVYDLFGDDEAEAPAPETLEIDGHSYIGYVSVPALGIELPVMAEWSYANLKIAPCCYRGSLRGHDLIICAHNYRSHFGEIHSLSSGDEILFTDVTGKTHRFAVMSMEQLAGTAVAEMQFGAAEDWDLTLFTCTLSGQSRVTVRAAEAKEGAA